MQTQHAETVEEMAAIDRAEIAEIENMMQADFIAKHEEHQDAVSDEIEKPEPGKRFNPLAFLGAFGDRVTVASLPKYDFQTPKAAPAVIDAPADVVSTEIVLAPKTAPVVSTPKVAPMPENSTFAPAPKAKKQKAPKVAPPVDDDLPPIPGENDREKMQKWARDYCRALCEKYQSVNLAKKLFGGAFNPGGGSLNWQLAAMPLDDSRLQVWAESARLSFDKKIGA